MIFIFTRISDATTVLLIQWLIQFKKEFFRFNTTRAFTGTSFTCDLDNVEDNATNTSGISAENISSFYFNGGNVLVPPGICKENDLDRQISFHLRSEAAALLEFELGKVNSKVQFGLSPFSTQKINKLTVLRLAKELGLNVPRTAVVSDKKRLEDLKMKWGRVINKSINEGMELETECFLVSGQRTEEVNELDIEKFSSTFFPSLFQELIEKKFELRVFYFRGGFHSIAIFSQSARSSLVDSRNVDYNRPSRQVPYLLPENIKLKIGKLMDALSLNYGSLDFIIGVDDRYHFLEVNPYGQYGFLSTAGNFYLEKKIAQYLQ